jgi:hypothetical protein
MLTIRYAAAFPRMRINSVDPGFTAGATSVAVDKNGMAMIVPWQGAIYRDDDSSPWVTIDGYAAGPTSVTIAR